MLGCADTRADNGIDVVAARALSDSVIAGLMHNQIDLVLDKIEPAFLVAVGRVGGEAGIRKLFDYCGRPVHLEFDRSQSWYILDGDGGRRRVQTFKYDATTKADPTGGCIWSVDVVRTDVGLRVAYVRAGHRVITSP